MPFQYKRVLLIGASSGIGEALADRFVQEGSNVIVVGRRKENLATLVHKHGHEKTAAVPFDISQLEQIPHFVQNITSTYPDLDCIFLNSGMQRTFDFSRPETVDLNLFTQELTVNYTAFVALTHAFLPFLLHAKHQTSLIFTTSNLAVVPIYRCPGYCATKAALHSFILALRSQLKDSNIKIMELMPPAVQTELHDAKHQPQIQDGGKIGMPLDEFTNLAYDGLVAGKDVHSVGQTNPDFHKIDELRHEIFWKMDEAVRTH